MEVILKGNAAWQSIEYKKTKIAEMVKKIVFFYLCTVCKPLSHIFWIVTRNEKNTNADLKWQI